MEVPGSKPDLCTSVVLLHCDDNDDTSIQASLHIEYLNQGTSDWNTGLSLEDQGLPVLFSLYSLAALGLGLVYWKYMSDLEAVGVHEDLAVVTKVMYAALALEMMSWWGFYMVYVASGTPWFTLKWLGALSEWTFQVSTLCFIALHCNGHFMQNCEVLKEIKVVMGIEGLITLYFTLHKATESENLAEFHWFCYSTAHKWLRLLVIVVLYLWSIQGWETYKPKSGYCLLVYGGLLWASGLPVTVMLSKWLLRFRWKFWQACLSFPCDLCFSAFLLHFLSPSHSLFVTERVTQSLKSP